MQNKNYLEAEFLDIIFQGRNKEYGAYFIRKTYPQRVKKALLCVLLLCSIPLLLLSFKPVEEESNILCDFTEPVEFITIDLPKNAGQHLGQMIKATPVEKDLKTYAVVKTKNVTPPEDKTEDDKPKDKVEDIIVSNTDPSDGIEAPNDLGGIPGSPNGDPDLGRNGNGSANVAVVPAPEPQKTPEFVEVMPEFPGGLDALSEFLQENIRYPDMAKQIGTTGQVVLVFVVDENGEISDIKIKKSVGNGCDAEAIRVVNKMPRWKAGSQNGQNVKVQYRLPIEFALED